MFTGLVLDVGRVEAVEHRGDTRFRISSALPLAIFEMGASIACSGACMTVVAAGEKEGCTWFDFEASAESLDKATLKHWQVGELVNLESSLKLGDAMGGHLVSGHVDGVGQVAEIKPVGDSHLVRFTVPQDLAPFIAQKGSVAVNGVSLTVNGVSKTGFDVNIIPHTWQATTFQGLAEGDPVNLEIDMLARYVARLLEFKA